MKKKRKEKENKNQGKNEKIDKDKNRKCKESESSLERKNSEECINIGEKINTKVSQKKRRGREKERNDTQSLSKNFKTHSGSEIEKREQNGKREGVRE